jgi:dipeptidyl aminopeptidase/acylaminoacyl peptidase
VSVPNLDGAARYRAMLTDPMLVRGGRIEPIWTAGAVAFIDHAGASPVARAVERASGAVRWGLDAATLGGAGPERLLLSPEGQLLLKAGERLFQVDAQSGVASDAPAAVAASLAGHEPRVTRPGYPTVFPPEREAPSPDRGWFLTLLGHDLALRPRAGGDPRPLTTGAPADPRWSTANAAWSPDGRRLAAMRIDERAVYRVPLIDWTGAERKVEWAVYPRADGPIQVWRLFLIEAEGGETVEIGGGDASHYAFNLGFSGDGAALRYARLERTAKQVEILEYEIVSGRTRTLLNERAETFLCWTPVFIREGPPIRFLTNGGFVWQSERTGWNQLYLHDGDGRLVRPLTGADYPVTNLVGVDEAAGQAFYRAQPDPLAPYDAQLFKVSLASAARVQLSAGHGVHEMVMAPDGGAYVETSSAPDRPPRAELRAADGRPVATLSTADASGLTSLGWTPPEPFVAKAADGETDLHGLIYKPAGFDPARRYPVIEYIYAGAQAQWTPHGFAPGVQSAFAQLGYIIVMLDGRGTPGRGKAFQDVVVDRLGDCEIADHAGAVRQAAASRPWMDLSRVGVLGLSYGGYFAIRALIQAPELYKSAVAMAPAELGPAIMSPPVESYIGLPREHPDRYAAIRNTDKLGDLAGDLLIITGTDDVNTPLEQTMAYAAALAAAGKAFDQIVIPGVNHAMSDAGGGAKNPFVFAAMLRHFARTLRP